VWEARSTLDCSSRLIMTGLGIFSYCDIPVLSEQSNITKSVVYLGVEVSFVWSLCNNI
jgi:hypothetical protein